jgi:hypothetical protein
VAEKWLPAPGFEPATLKNALAPRGFEPSGHKIATPPRGSEPSTSKIARIRQKAATSEVAIGPKSAGASFVDEIGSFGYNSVLIFRD